MPVLKMNLYNLPSVESVSLGSHRGGSFAMPLTVNVVFAHRWCKPYFNG